MASLLSPDQKQNRYLKSAIQPFRPCLIYKATAISSSCFLHGHTVSVNPMSEGDWYLLNNLAFRRYIHSCRSALPDRIGRSADEIVFLLNS